MDNSTESNWIDSMDPLYVGPEGLRAFYEWLASIALFIGIVCNLLIIIILGFNARFRTKTYLLILNVAIGDILMLCSFTETISIIYGLGMQTKLYVTFSCIFDFLEELLQFQVVLFLIILSSNTLMKSDRFKISHILILTYIILVSSFLAHTVTCSIIYFPWGYLGWFFLYFFFVVYILVKECNACYKRFVKKDALNAGTKFRMDFARIYCYNWCFVHFCMFWYDMMVYRDENFYALIFARLLGYVNSLFFVIYLFRCDRLFKTCLLHLVHLRKMDADSSTTVTYVEEVNEDDVFESVPESRDIRINVDDRNSRNRSLDVDRENYNEPRIINDNQH